MRALLRKDAVWMLPLAVGGMIVGLIAMTTVTGSAGVWYRPDSKFGPGSLVFFWIAAGVLGLCAGLFEDVTFAREYLVHRPVSAARLFWTRQLGCALVLLSWAVITPALHLGATLLFHRNAALVEPGRYWSMLNSSSLGVAFYAVTLFATVAVRRAVLAVIIAFALSLALLMFFGLSLYAHTETEVVVWPLLAPISAALAAVLLLASQRLAREPRDVDQPVSPARLGWGLVALGGYCLAGSAFLHILQLDLRRDIMRRYPSMSRLPDGTPVLVVQKDYGPPWRVDERHRRADGSVEHAETGFLPREVRSLYPREEPFGGRGQRVGGVRYQRFTCNVAAYCFVGTDGRVHLYGYDQDDGPALVRHLAKQTGQPFTPRARALGYWGRYAHIAEPDEGVVWRVDLQGGGPGFEPVSLPGGDRFREDLTHLLELRPPDGLSFVTPPTTIRGEHGIYVPEKDGFVAAPPEIVSAVQALDRRRQRPEATVALEGPVRFRVTLPAAGGAPAFTHDYAPYTPAEKTLSVQMHGLSLMRPPMLMVASLLFPRTGPTLGNPTDDDTRILLDPLVMLGARWVLVLDLLLGAALAALAFRRLTRLGAPRSRRLFWTAVVFCLGPVGFVVYRVCETKRAWHPVPETVKQPMLIQSAAA
jgi:hypothetical protein